MSDLVYEFFHGNPVLAFPMLALVIFVATFVAVSWQAARTSKSDIDARARMPLGSDAEARHE